MINVCLYDFGGRWYKKRGKIEGGGDMFLFRPDWAVAGGRRQPLPMHFYAGFFVSLDTTTVGLHFTYTSYDITDTYLVFKKKTSL